MADDLRWVPPDLASVRLISMIGKNKSTTRDEVPVSDLQGMMIDKRCEMMRQGPFGMEE